MGISRKQFALLARAAGSKQGAKILLDNAANEKDPTAAYDKIKQALEGGTPNVSRANEAIKPIDEATSDSQPSSSAKVESASAIKQIEQKYKYEKFENIKDGEKFLNKTLKIPAVSLKGFEIDEANQIVEAFSEVYNRFPELEGFMNFTGSIFDVSRKLFTDSEILLTLDGTFSPTTDLGKEIEKVLFNNYAKESEKARSMALAHIMNAAGRKFMDIAQKRSDEVGGMFVYTDVSKTFRLKNKLGFAGLMLNDRDKNYKKTYTRISEEGFGNPVFKEDPKQTMKIIALHELGHLIDYAFGVKKGKETLTQMLTKEEVLEIAKKYTLDEKQLKETIGKYYDLNFAKDDISKIDYINDMYKFYNEGAEEAQKVMFIQMYHLGKYSTTNKKEMFAEAFANVAFSKNPNKYAIDIVNAVLGKAGKSIWA